MTGPRAAATLRPRTVRRLRVRVEERSLVPASRRRRVNARPIRPEGRWVLYWMIAARRTRSNFALERAIGLARELGRPLIVLEALELDYPWASERLNRFVVDGMREQRARFEPTPVTYYPYLEPEPGAGNGLLESLAADACIVITDDSTAFFLPSVVEAAGQRLEVALEAIDSNGLLPLRATTRAFTTAHSFRRWLQRELPEHLEAWPRSFPLRGSGLPSLSSVPAAIRRRWPPASTAMLRGEPAALAPLDLDRSVPATAQRGGSRAARSRLRAFVEDALPRYLDHNHPDAEATSGLSPFLHFGHISTHEVFEAVAAAEGWTPGLLPERADGRREGWWGMSAPAEAFLDELVTWRELAYNGATHLPAYERFDSLPDWARRTLEEHATDPREHVYTLEELAAASTHDEIWNAAQRQLRREGTIHGYLRMLWGKKILEWTRTPEEALTVMVELNNRYALDGRDPNSYAGIAWVLGRYDRAWGPERAIFGKVRYMSSEQARRKLRMTRYLEQFAPGSAEST